MESDKCPSAGDGSLSKLILNYYHHYGQNRDLEKYLIRKNLTLNGDASEADLKSSRGTSPEQLDTSTSKLRSRPLPIVNNEMDTCSRRDSRQSPTVAAASLSHSNSSTSSKPNNVSLEKSGKMDDQMSQSNGEATEDSVKLNTIEPSEHNTKSIKRLEWDSLGDVGYYCDKSSSSKSCLANSISSTEKNALKNFFSKCGIEIMVKHNETKNVAIESQKLEAPKQQKAQEKWRNTLELARKKYGIFAHNNNSNISPFLTKFEDNHFHSTPIIVPSSNKKNTKTEQYCQTSTIETQNREIQADLSNNDDSSRTANDCGLASFSSFEYISQAGDSLDRRVRMETLQASSISDATGTEPDKLKTVRSANKNYEKDDLDYTELNLGIKLLCSLIEAKSLKEKQKVRLARKIARKITNQAKDLTTSSTSVSSDEVIKSMRTETNEQSKDKEKVEQKCEVSPKYVNDIGNLYDKPSTSSTANRTDKPTYFSNKTKIVSTEDKLKPKPENSTTQDRYDGMKDWLDPLTRSERLYSGNRNKKLLTKAPSSKFIENDKHSHIFWIESEIKHLEDLKHLLINGENTVEQKQLLNKQNINTYPLSKGRAHIYDRVAHSAVIPFAVNSKISCEVKSNSTPDSNSQTSVGTGKSTSQSSSSKVEDNLKKHRSKLETPKSQNNESVRSFARQRKEDFLEAYKSKERAYDRPTENSHYSEPRDVKAQFQKNDAFTSVTSSDFFISSESISIPCSGSTSTTTTTHQYDTRFGIGIQTSNSLRKTVPIFGPSECCRKTSCGNHCSAKTTIRVQLPKFDKQTQVQPKALAYVITFDKTATEDDSGQVLTLQEHLLKARPEFSKRSDKRQHILKTLQTLRKEREAQMRNIVENTSYSSISRKLTELPPPPIKYTRIFPTTKLKAITKKRYKRLPEVVAKLEKVKSEQEKRTNRILTSLFNKKLQKRVRSGKLSLDHGRTII